MVNKQKDTIKKKNINLRISEEQEEEWDLYRKEKRFPSLSSFVRYCVEEEIIRNSQTNENHETLKNLNIRVGNLENFASKMTKENKNLLKEIALRNHKSEINSESKLLKDFQKKTIINLLKKEIMDEHEILRVIDIPETFLYVIINELIEEGIIVEDEHKYMYRRI